MKNLLIRIVVLLLVFAGGVVAFSSILDKGNTGLTAEMSAATLPVAYTEVEGMQVNRMQGYTQEMDANYVRDSITPLPQDRKLTVLIREYGNAIRNLTYEVRSIDTTRLVEDTQVTDFSQSDGYFRVVLPIKDLLEQGQEYILKLIVETEDATVDYYTRIVYDEEMHAKDCVDFMQSFSDATFEKEEADFDISKYLEPNSQGDNSTFQHVTIHSKLSQVNWGGMEVKRAGEAEVSIKEISPTATSAVLQYTVTAPDENGKSESYHVSEFFRVRYTQDRMYLLDYDRTMEQVFDQEGAQFGKQSIYLGIRDSEIDFKTNEKGDKISFVQEREMWQYDQTEDKMSRVFSFYDGKDQRASYDQHEIKIIDVDEEGNTDFMVYGYMNRGRHEGKSGVCVYKFSSVSNTIEETAFISSPKSFQLLDQDVGVLSYVNKAGKLFLMINGSLYQIDLASGSCQTLASGIKEGCYNVSGDNRLFAWQEQNDPYHSTSITVMDLENGFHHTVNAEEGEYIRALGFVDTDFMYGAARQEDLETEVTGNVLFPMYRLVILNEEEGQKGAIAKDLNYGDSGLYISDAAVTNNRITLYRVEGSAGGYTRTDEDYIMTNAAQEEQKVNAGSYVSELKETVYQISLLWPVENAKPKLLHPKEVLFEDSREVVLEEAADPSSRFYVYGRGRLQAVYAEAGPAIRQADEIMGVVVADNQKYVWERGNRKLRTKLSDLSAETIEEGKTSLSVCLDVMLKRHDIYINSQEFLNSGQSTVDILNEQLENRAVDLTGCTLEETFYYISNGAPVLGMIDGTNAVLIIGYDEVSVSYLNPSGGSIEKKGLKASSEMFEAAGNVFISYVK